MSINAERPAGKTSSTTSVARPLIIEQAANPNQGFSTGTIERKIKHTTATITEAPV